jgi:hypothetical protein
MKMEYDVKRDLSRFMTTEVFSGHYKYQFSFLSFIFQIPKS